MTPQELKNSILKLAMQGKLVEQRPEEGTGKELYQQIQEEKKKLINEGKIKKEKELLTIANEEILYDIPDNWMWVRLGDYAEKITDQVASGSFKSLRENVRSLKEPDYAVMVKTADFANGFTSNLTYTDKHGYEFLSNSNLYGGELILSNIGSIGKCFIVPDLGCKMTLAPNSVMIRLVNDELRDYLYYYILSPQGYQELIDITSGTAMKKFNKTDLKTILIPVPPLAEQKRIVAKIEELLPYIDKYAEAWEKLEDFNKRFPVDMKKSILQTAVQGKLVPQDPNDESASVLLERVRAEKEQLIKAGKIKRDKHEFVIYRRDNSHYEKLDGIERCIDDEIPFEIPESWVWVRLGSVSNYDGKKQKINAAEADPSLWELDLEDIEKGGRLLAKKTVGERKAVGDKTIFQAGEILYSKLRPYLLKILVAPANGICTSEIVPFSVYGEIDAEYIVCYLKSPTVDFYINSITYGIKMPRVGTSTMTNLLVPIPPLNEQRRIVAKIEELLPLCDQLNN